MNGPWKSINKLEPEHPETLLWKRTDQAAPTTGKIRGIGFDLGETLIIKEGLGLNWREHYPDALREAALKCHFDATPRLIDCGITVLEKNNARITPRKREVNSDNVFREILANSGFSTHSIQVTSFSKAFFDYFLSDFHLREEAIPMLEILKEKSYALGILSDVPYGQKPSLFQAWLTSFPALTTVVPVVMTSVDTGWRKPAIQSFFALARKMKVRPQHIAYVGNEEKDVSGATDAGMTAILLDTENKTPDWNYNYRIASLSELPDLIQKIQES